MNIHQSINRGFNLLCVSLVSLVGFAFLSEVFLEKDIPDKLDDLFLLILAGIAMFWYSRSNNKYMRSVIPVVFVILALLIKIFGIIVEHDDPDALGDDIGGLVLLLLSSGLVLYQFKKTAKLLANVPLQ